MGRADFEDLRHQCWIVRDPVSHNYTSAWSRHPDHLLGDVEGLGREHRSKDAHDQVEAAIFQILQVGGIAFLKLAVAEAVLAGAPPGGCDQVTCYVDAQHVGAKLRLRQRGRAVAASEVQNFKPCCDAKGLHERVAARSHGFRNAGKVAFFPERLVWIHGGTPILLMGASHSSYQDHRGGTQSRTPCCQVAMQDFFMRATLYWGILTLARRF